MNATTPPDPGPAADLGEALEFVAGVLDRKHMDVVVVVDSHLRVAYWNPIAEVVSGISREQAAGEHVHDLVPRLRQDDGDRYLAEALAGRHVGWTRGFFAASGPGAELRFEAAYAPLHGPGGRVAGALVIARDLSGPATVEEQLRETEARFRTMADCAPVMLWMSGLDARCDFFNQTWLRFTGRTMEQETGYGWAEGVHPEDFQACVDTYMAAFNARRSFVMVYRLRRHDGLYRWILDTGAPRTSQGGAFAGFIGSCIDISDRKDAEDSLRRTADRLARANAELERFAWAASHDLQEPLRIVATYCDLVGQRCGEQLGPDGSFYIARAAEAAARMQRRIQDLLAYARAGAVDTPFRRVDARKACQEAIDNLQAAITETGAEVTVGPLPDVTGDPAQIVQVFQNLVGNAVKFRRDGEAPRIAIAAAPRGPDVEFSVRDHGIGIEERHLDQVFQIFKRLHAADRYPGTGVGLALCKKIVERHGGTIRCESGSGAGTTFSFTLPAAKPRSND